MKQIRGGFTLIELSIVLLVIGLVLGGVMVGRSMIKTAELERIIRQKNELANGIGLFNERYKQWPGDFAAYDDELGGGITGGDNNGIIGYTAAGLVANRWDEVNNVYVHLGKANLLGEGKRYTTATLGITSGNFAWQVGTEAPPGPAPASVLWIGTFRESFYGRAAFDKNYLVLTAADDIRGGAVSLEDAMALDAAYDDGVAATGNIRAYRPWDGDTPIGNACVSDVATAATATYLTGQTSSSIQDCVLELGSF